LTQESAGQGQAGNVLVVVAVECDCRCSRFFNA